MAPIGDVKPEAELAAERLALLRRVFARMFHPTALPREEARRLFLDVQAAVGNGDYCDQCGSGMPAEGECPVCLMLELGRAMQSG